MNRKGFTLVELLATIVVLAIVVGISVPSVTGIIQKSKEKSEDAFIETIKDAMSIYLSSSASGLVYDQCQCLGYDSIGEYTTITLEDVINSPYRPLKKGELFNPANKEMCSPDDVMIRIYRSNNYAYYYVMDKAPFDCFKYSDGQYISNLEKPEELLCQY